MKIKNIIFSTIIATATMCYPLNSRAFDLSIDSDDYFKIRSEIKSKNFNDFQAKKFCETTIGTPVRFTSKVVDVNKDGVILADMDIDKVLSLPEIYLTLSSEKETLSVNDGQVIQYTGNISDCYYGTNTGIFQLAINNGKLQLHY